MLGSLGREFIVDDQVTFETIAWHTRQILKVPSIPFEIELFDLSDEPFDLSRFERRVKTSIGGHDVWLPTTEHVVVQKLRWASLGNRGKDFLDALGVAKVRREKLAACRTYPARLRKSGIRPEFPFVFVICVHTNSSNS